MSSAFTVGPENAEFKVDVTDDVVSLYLNDVPLPLPMYIQEEDPGAVGAFKPWLRPSTGQLQFRNTDNDDWVAVAGGGTVAPPIDDPGPVPDPTVINMVAAGAVGDGTTDNSNIIQSIINAAPAGAVFHFDAGTYAFNALDFQSRNFLTFEGATSADPDATTFLYNGPTVNPSYTRLWTFTSCQNLVFKNFAVNNRNIPRYGGLAHYNIKTATWDNLHIYDDQPQGGATGVTTTDRYGIVVGFGGAPNFSDNLTFTNIIHENLQFEVDHSKNVTMRNILVDGACCTGSLGNFAITTGSGNFCENWLMEDIVINNPRHGNQGAMPFKLDSTGISNTTWRNIVLRRVTINLDGRVNGPLGAITFGGPNASGPGNIWTNITLEDVTINLADDADCVSKGAIDFLTATALWRFTFVTLRRVRVLSAAKSGLAGLGMMLRGIVSSTVEECEVVNFATGIKCTVGMQNTTIQNNQVEGCSVGYHLEGISTGNNFTGNTYTLVGTPLVQVNVPPGQNIVAPTSFTPADSKTIAATLAYTTVLPDVASPALTLITESFNKADSSVLGPDRSWTKLVGDISVVSNQARSVTLGTHCIARCDNDLTSVDHYVQAVVGAGSEAAAAYAGVLGRIKGDGSLTFYLLQAGFHTNMIHLHKCVAGVFTLLDEVSLTLNAGTTYTLRLEMNGTSIIGLVDAVQRVTATDSSIADGLRTGARGYKLTSSYVSFDSFEAGVL